MEQNHYVRLTPRFKFKLYLQRVKLLAFMDKGEIVLVLTIQFFTQNLIQNKSTNNYLEESKACQTSIGCNRLQPSQLSRFLGLRSFRYIINTKKYFHGNFISYVIGYTQASVVLEGIGLQFRCQKQVVIQIIIKLFDYSCVAQ